MTTCVLINTPNNPTGVVYSAGTLTRMAEILTEKSKAFGHNIFLVSDEPYRDIAFDGKKVPYPAAFYPHTFTCFSYSKSLSLPGERLGYVAVRPGCEGEDVLVVRGGTFGEEAYAVGAVGQSADDLAPGEVRIRSAAAGTEIVLRNNGRIDINGLLFINGMPYLGMGG